MEYENNEFSQWFPSNKLFFLDPFFYFREWKLKIIEISSSNKCCDGQDLFMHSASVAIILSLPHFIFHKFLQPESSLYSELSYVFLRFSTVSINIVIQQPKQKSFNLQTGMSVDSSGSNLWNTSVILVFLKTSLLYFR